MDLLDNNDAYTQLKNSLDNYYSKTIDVVHRDDLQQHANSLVTQLNDQRVEVEITKMSSEQIRSIVNKNVQDIEALKKEAEDNRKNDEITQRLSEDTRREYRRMFDELRLKIDENARIVEEHKQLTYERIDKLAKLFLSINK